MMKAWAVFIAIALLSGCGTLKEYGMSAEPRVDAAPKRILFVGNSYLYYGNSLHNHVRMLARTGDPSLKRKLKYKSATISGARLDHHNIEHLTQPGALGVEEPFEWVVLQGFSAAALSDEGRQRFRKTVVEFDKLIRERGSQTALYMTHAYVSPNRRAKDENIELIEDLYVSVGKETGARVIPVGLAFEEAYRRQPDIQLHKSFDGSHPDVYGTYLAACTVYASLYGKSPVGNEYDYFDRIEPEVADFLQRVAQETVLKFNASANVN